jgi:hypothetical protein
MISKADTEYFLLLRTSFSEAVKLEFCYNARIDAWTPDARHCHDNVDYCARHKPRFQPVRGWLKGNDSFIKPHSVLRDMVSGELIDITPSDSTNGEASKKPWAERMFVCHEGSEEQFRDLLTRHGGGFNYVLLRESR